MWALLSSLQFQFLPLDGSKESGLSPFKFRRFTSLKARGPDAPSEIYTDILRAENQDDSLEQTGATPFQFLRERQPDSNARGAEVTRGLLRIGIFLQMKQRWRCH